MVTSGVLGHWGTLASSSVYMLLRVNQWRDKLGYEKVGPNLKIEVEISVRKIGGNMGDSTFPPALWKDIVD